MKALLNDLYAELETELAKSPDLRVQQLIDLDENLEESVVRFESMLAQDQRVQWDEVRGHIEALRQYAKMAKLRLLMGDEETRGQIEELRGSDDDEGEDYQEAQLEVERDMHRPKGITDVFKALLMYRDNPEEKMKKKD